ncbi:class I adenylate-forming enzyme family protein [Rhodococcus erythropolis]|uniref:Long-chain fatty acid--CoA ligase n=1 Tax=Rhodococcus erythropolis TaxID=1833 RepID=A0A8I0ZVH9_RHOER|nr:long-chain fatty acid--CoA ligase [Rhodococcus erythropolis]MBH5143512.1 long-chain fatty acid--CoA ligase [Rhodococcus erythropolis]
MSSYDDKIWLKQYPDPGKSSLEIEFDTALDMFKSAVARGPDRDAIRYYDRRITFRELDELSDAFAVGILDSGFRPGERLVIYAQNIPQFLIVQLGTWKAGGIAVSANPMYRSRELTEILQDSGATVLVSMQGLYRDVASLVVQSTDVRTVITTSELEYQSVNGGQLATVTPIECPDTIDMAAMLAEFRGQTPQPVDLGPDSIAFLTYTSGTTGPPKGAMTTHRNVVFNAQTYREWVGLDSTDVILGVAPLFHITGLIAHIAISLLTGAPLILMGRMDPAETIRTIEKQRATFTVGSITVFIALMNTPEVQPESLASLTKIYSGGAPIPPSTIRAFEEKFGHYIHNIYGLTETTSPSHGVPFGVRAPVDKTTGATSVGVPVYDTVVRIVDENGNDLPPGEIGELVTAGPQVVAGYWNKPEATANALPGGVLHTGDVGFMDSDGWFYIVDRKKDQINASGYKVWPREVEDVLYEHEAVREAAVVGVPDEYRGETVKAFVSLRPGMSATPEELIAHCKSQMAAYKYPREIEIMNDIPKTSTGKLLRRALRTSPS